MSDADQNRKKALKILFTTYWSSKGWRAEKDQVTLPEDLLYARRAGVMWRPSTASSPCR